MNYESLVGNLAVSGYCQTSLFYRRRQLLRIDNLHFAFAVEFDFRGESKVRYLDPHVVIEKHVPELQISVDDALIVDVSAPLHQLAQVVPHFRFHQRLTVLQHVYERLWTKDNQDDFYATRSNVELECLLNLVIVRKSQKLEHVNTQA